MFFPLLCAQICVAKNHNSNVISQVFCSKMTQITLKITPKHAKNVRTARSKCPHSTLKMSTQHVQNVRTARLKSPRSTLQIQPERAQLLKRTGGCAYSDTPSYY